MPEAQDTEERPCLHCMMVELIENFFAERGVWGARHNRHRRSNYCACKDSGRLNVQPGQCGSPTDNRNFDARNYGIRCRVSS